MTLKQRLKLPCVEPDGDNYEKLLNDALKGKVFANDGQITTCITRKRYGSPPRIEVEIEEDKE